MEKDTIPGVVICIKAPEHPTKENIERVITDCWKKWNALHIKLGGKGLLLHMMKNGCGEYVRFENRQCAERVRVALNVELVSQDQADDPIILDKMIALNKQENGDGENQD